MSNLNQCNFVGRLGEDAAQKSFPDGTAVCNISIAVNKKFKDKQTGEQKTFTSWPNLIFTDRLAEILCEYTNKGDRIRVMAEYRPRKWQTNQGESRYAHEFLVRELELLDHANTSSGRTNQQHQTYSQRANSQPFHRAQQLGKICAGMQAPADIKNFSDDIPF